MSLISWIGSHPRVLTDGADPEIPEGLEVGERDSSDGAGSVDAFGSEVIAVALEDVVHEFPGADGHPCREVAESETEDFGEAQPAAAGEFRA